MKNLKLKNKNLGMTYVELIVVLSIFSIMSGVVLFNYQDFNKRVEVKSVANDIALKIVEIQKDATGGKLPGEKDLTIISSSWKPSYGLYFDKNDFTNFKYFTDLDSDGSCDTSCEDSQSGAETEYLDTININPKYKIKSLRVYCDVVGSNIDKSVLLADAGGSVVEEDEDLEVSEDAGYLADKLSVVFRRSSPQAIIRVSDTSGVPCSVSTAVINLSSANSNSVDASVTVYSSGRIQIK